MARAVLAPLITQQIKGQKVSQKKEQNSEKGG